MSLAKAAAYVARNYNLGRPSIDTMSEFMSNTDTRAKPKDGIEGEPSSDELNRLSRIAHIIKYKRTQYFFHHEDKYIALFQDSPMHRIREILTDKLIISDSINEFSKVIGIDKSIYDFSVSTNI